jgi:hypothetical protein
MKAIGRVGHEDRSFVRRDPECRCESFPMLSDRTMRVLGSGICPVIAFAGRARKAEQRKKEEVDLTQPSVKTG